MTIRNLRSIYLGGVALRALATVDGEEPAPGGAGAEPAAAPDPEPAEPAPDAGGGGDDGGAEPAAPAAATAAEPAEPPKSTRRPWYEKRIDSLTAGQRTAEEAAATLRREADEAKGKLAAYEALYGKQDGSGPAAPAAAPAPPADGRTYTQAEVQAEAARIAGLQTLNSKLDSMFDAGVTKHGDDFKQRVTQVQAAFGEELKTRVDLFSALSDLPNAADVYHELTGDLDHFAEVLAMSPVQLGMELARISTKAGAKPRGPQVSKVPPPIEPLAGNGTVEASDLTKVDMNTYAATRAAQREARFKEKGYH